MAKPQSTKVSTQSESAEIKHAFIGDEKYGLSWTGKEKAFQLIRETAKGTLVPQEKESVNWDKTGNVFIEGDNLEVLKLLQKHYRNAVKMIYIDPPYNTGKDFIYKDNFTEGLSDYYERTGQSKDGVKLTANLESNGRYHSDWLTMMYPRLFLARNLLKDDGVIFVSIDDNEVANLRLIMDEIFGEENFVATTIWNTTKGAQGMTTKNMIVPNHEYILVYAKTVEQFSFLGLTRDTDGFSNHDNDPRGLWKRQYLQRLGQGLSTRTVIDPSTGNKFMFETPYTQEKLDKWIKEDRIIFPKDTSKYPARKEFISEYENNQQLITDIGLYATKATTEKLYGLFDGKKIFTNPKPDSLIQYLIKVATTGGDLILDFFAGSGTTAHAVMSQNAEDGGNRKWIAVQLPETMDEDSEAFKAGYKNIAEIARERIRRVGKKIGKGDIGFKSFGLSKSNYRQWNVLTDKDDEAKLKAQMKLFVEKPLVDKYEEESVVYEILLKEGFDLNAKVVKEKVKALEVYKVSDIERNLIITFAKKLTMDQVEPLKLGENDTFVCLDSALDDTTKVNLGREVSLKTI